MLNNKLGFLLSYDFPNRWVIAYLFAVDYVVFLVEPYSVGVPQYAGNLALVPKVLSVREFSFTVSSQLPCGALYILFKLHPTIWYRY